MKVSLFSSIVASALAVVKASGPDLDGAVKDLQDITATAQAADKSVSPHRAPLHPIVPIANVGKAYLSHSLLVVAEIRWKKLQSRIRDIELLLSDVVDIFEDTLPSDLNDSDRLKFCIPIKDAIASQKTLVEDLFQWSGIFTKSHIPIRSCYESWARANTNFFNLLNGMGVDSCGWNQGAFYGLLGTLKGLIHSVPLDVEDEL
ncbi:hypothetical protein PT974_04385 [Cladobotryum mycophilum]|uniref:Uncharacterized protein n=1 Tax=Cladobotryum mycophilum TaxID=491253 RepID=A0ABR0SUU7_9HYPO